MEKINRYIEIEGYDDYLVDLFPYKVKDQSNFYFRNHPNNLSPSSFAYRSYWETFLKFSLEGKWVNDGGTWVFMMPKLFFYINYVVISDKKRKRTNPTLMDNVWIMFTYFLCCEGFSGFEGDEKYTCNKYVGKLQNGERLQPHEERKLEEFGNIRREDGSYKIYVDPWEYLTETYLLTDNRNKPLGRPLYDNGYYHCMVISARATFKSFSVFMGLFLHEWLFSGVKRYEDRHLTSEALLFGLTSTEKSALERSIGNLDRAYSSFPGQMDMSTKKKGKSVRYMGAFYKNTRGLWKVDKTAIEVRHLVKSKQGKALINGSQCQIQTISGKNEKIFTGDRFRMGIIEEVGFCNNLKAIYIACKDAFHLDDEQVGMLVLLGCVCAGTKVYTKSGEVKNIEDLKVEDGIIGYNGKSSAEQVINFIKPPAKKNCYRITTDNNSVIECSDDHPLLITRRHFQKNIKGKTIKRSIYQEAKDIKVKDQLLVPSKVDIFGSRVVKNARLYGLLIGDGNYSINSYPTLSVSEKDILEYCKPLSSGSSKNYVQSNGEYYSQLRFDKFLKKELEENGMYGQVKESKRLPNDVHTYSKESLADLLAGYFDADGNVYYNEKKNIVRIVLTSICKELLEEVKYQLFKFGIHCAIIKEKRNGIPSAEFKGQKDHIYRLYINQQQDIILFRDNIKLLNKNKANKLSHIKDSKYKVFDTVFELNPLNNKEGYFNREDNSNILKDLRYETVTKVEFIGEREVYNLNCNDNHNYISSKFITRQTGGDMEKIKDSKDMFENPEIYNIFGIPNYWSKNKNKKSKCGLMLGANYKKESLKINGNTNQYEALVDIVKYREEQRASLDNISFASDIAFNPIYPSELLKPTKKSPLPIIALSEHRDLLIDNDVMQRLSSVGSLKYRNGRVVFEPDLEGTLEPILEWGKDEKLMNNVGAWVIHEPPPTYIPDDLYYVLLDPYTQSGEGTSLMAIYVYKYKFKNRGQEDSLEDTFVASYVGRLSNLDDSFDEVIKAAHYFNAKVFPELNSIGFAEYVDRKNLRNMMLFIPKAVLEPIKGSTASSHGKSYYGFGIKVNEAMNIWSINRLAEWMLKPTEIDEKTQIPMRFNYQRIRDLRLLSEAINFVFENKVDYDAMSAVMLLPYILSYLDGVEVEMPNQYEDSMDLKYKKANTVRREKVLVSKLSATI